MQASVQSVTKNQINFDMDANKNCELLSQQLLLARQRKREYSLKKRRTCDYNYVFLSIINPRERFYTELTVDASKTRGYSRNTSPPPRYLIYSSPCLTADSNNLPKKCGK